MPVLARKGIFRSPPRVRVDASGNPPVEQLARTVNRGFAEVYAVLFANLHQNALLTPFRHGVPGPAFRGIYLWDSAFISRIWLDWEPTVAEEIVAAVMDVRDGDRLQHVVSDFMQSPFTQPPLVAWAVGRQLVREGGSRILLRDHHDALWAYQEWLDMNRRLKNGLYFWAHPYESGVENSPRFSSRDESWLADTRSVAAVDLSCYVVLQWEAIGLMAKALGEDEAAGVARGKAAELRTGIMELLWDRNDGCFYDFDLARGDFVREETITSLLPLWAGAANAGQVERMVARIKDSKGYRTRMPLPSLPLESPNFDNDMWRGPVWINLAYGVICGLERCGEADLAADLSWEICRGVWEVFETEGRFYEFYDPTSAGTEGLSRKRGNRWKRLTLGSGPQKDFVGWTGLVNVLWIEHVVGYRREVGRAELVPCFPHDLAGAAIRLEMPVDGIVINVQEVKTGGGAVGCIRRGDRELKFDLDRRGVMDIQVLFS